MCDVACASALQVRQVHFLIKEMICELARKGWKCTSELLPPTARIVTPDSRFNNTLVRTISISQFMHNYDPSVIERSLLCNYFDIETTKLHLQFVHNDDVLFCHYRSCCVGDAAVDTPDNLTESEMQVH
jgi:hypothetical protein